MTHFSTRTPSDMFENEFSQSISSNSSANTMDLTITNPTQCGFNYPDGLLDGLNGPQSTQYAPDALGSIDARKTIAEAYAQDGLKVDPANILLTASTSEAYSYLFKLLCDPRDQIHIPVPGYPLLEHLAKLDAVTALPYRLLDPKDWALDLESLKGQLTPKSRAIIAVEPNNPTGSQMNAQDREAITALCEKNDLALILDEVFKPYSIESTGWWTNGDRVLTFRLGGLSKSVGLPQLKLSWIVIQGPTEAVKESRERLELIADTYLSVNTPVQVALRGILAHAPGIQKQIKERIAQNRKTLESSLKDLKGKVEVLPYRGGWMAILRLLDPSMNDEQFALDLIEKHKTIVHPGSFYELQGANTLVLSLLLPIEDFNKGIQAIRVCLNVI